MLKLLATMALDGKEVTVRAPWGAEFVMPFECELGSAEQSAEARRFARIVWHPSVMLQNARIVRGSVVYDVLERLPASSITAVLEHVGGAA